MRIFANDVKNKGALKCRQDNVKEAALAMEQNMPNLTKQTIIKASKYSIRQINQLSKADYSALDKSVEEFNQECNDIIAQSEEGAIEDKIIQIAKPLYDKFITFVTKWRTGIIAVGAIIAFIKVGIPLIRACIYHFKSWRIRMSTFFEEQIETTNANIEYLIELRDKCSYQSVPVACVNSLNRFREKLSSGISSLCLSVILDDKSKCSFIFHNVRMRIFYDVLSDSVCNPCLCCFCKWLFPVKY